MKNKTRQFLAFAITFLILAAAIIPVFMNDTAEAAAKPGTVTLTAISAPAYNQIKINWKKTSNATHYRIYYRRSDTTKWTRIKTVDNTKTSYTHKTSEKYPFSVGKKYYYTVRGYNSKTKESGGYNKTGFPVVIPKTVSYSSYGSSKNGVYLEWEKVSGATHYKIYYKKKSDDKWIKIKTVDKSVLSYTYVPSDKYPAIKGVNYSFAVSAYSKTYNTNGKYKVLNLPVKNANIIPSDNEDPKPTTVPNPTEAPKPTSAPNPTNYPKPTSTPAPTTKPSVVTLIGIESGDETATIYWKPLDGFNSYVVYRKHESDVIWTGKDVKAEPATYKGTQCLKYTDEAAWTGCTSYYTVCGVNSKTGEQSDHDEKGLSIFVKKSNKPVEMTSFSMNDMEVWMKDGPFDVDIKIYPENAVKPQFTWIVEDPTILRIDNNGRATALKTGKTMVRAVSPKGVSNGCYITVYDVDDMIKQAIELTNQERVKNGKAPFKTHPNLSKLAQIRAEELIIKFSHDRPNDAEYSDLAAQTGSANTTGGENIAAGHISAKRVVEAWMKSAGHRSAIMNPDYTYVGVGVARRSDGCWFWSMNFAKGDPGEKIKIIFDSMGGSYIEPVYIPADVPFRVYEHIQNPTKDGYYFDGWYRDPEYLSSEVKTLRPSTPEYTIYAKWNKL